MKSAISIFLFAISSSLLSPGLLAQDTSEEISGMSNSKLRREIVKAREQVYEIYSALNTDDEFDVTCEDFRSAQSLIRERVCQPVFLSRAYSESARDMVNNQGTAIGPGQQIGSDGSVDNGYTPGDRTGFGLSQVAAVKLSQAEINEKNRILAEKMAALANEDAELNGAVMYLRALNDAYLERQR